MNDAISLKSILFLHTKRVVAYFVLGLLSVLCLFSIYILIINSTRSHYEIQQGFSFLPGNSFIDNVKNVFSDSKIKLTKGLFWSLFIAGLSATLTVFFSAATAYGIHMYNFKFKKFAFLFILLVMMVPTQISALGLVQMCFDAGLTSGYSALIPMIVPSIASPVVFFYMKQYLESVLPNEMIESSRVDGAGEIRIFFQMVLPILKPAMAIQFIFAFVGSWNNYFIPALLIQGSNKITTLPIIISNLKASDPSTFDMGKVYMIMLIAVVPLIIVYLIFSKLIIRGLTAGAVKG